MDTLNLRNHHITRVAGRKAARCTGHLGRVGGRCHDRGFLHHHWNDIFSAIDQKVHGDTNGQLKGPNHIFDHMVSDLQLQRLWLGQKSRIPLRQTCKFHYLGRSLGSRQFVKAGILVCFHLHLSFLPYPPPTVHHSVSTFMRIKAEPMDLPSESSRSEWVAPPPKACFITKFIPHRVSTS